MNRMLALGLGAAAVIVLATAACNDDDGVTGSRGSLAAVSVDAPSQVQSGNEFTVEVEAANVGLSNIRNGRVEITFDSPLAVLSADASAGTSATIAGPNRVTWDLGTLDANTRSRLETRVIGVLAPGELSRSARIRAELTGQGIPPGDAVATDFVTIAQ